jgi:hypothetical protein
MSDTSNEAPRRRGRPPGSGKAKIVKAESPQTPSGAAVEAVLSPVAEPARPSVRPALREDPRLAAARRAAEIRGHFQGNMDDGTDRFAAPMPPEGWTYEWKRKSVMGMEDHSHMTNLKRAGWEEVPVDLDADHRSMMPHNWSGNTIERDGLVLMMRPSVITEEMRQIELRRARGQVQAKEQQLNEAPMGQFERTNKDQSLAKVKKGYEPIAVPKE